MHYLLDTHTFIWWMESGDRLSPKTKIILQDLRQEIFVSIASVWDIVLKQSKGKLKIPRDIKGGIIKAGFKILPIEFSHVLEVRKLPLHKDHRDPFDRMLVSQAKVEKLTLITSDPKIWQYNIHLLKA